MSSPAGSTSTSSDRRFAEKTSLGRFPTPIRDHATLGEELGVRLFVKHDYAAERLGAGTKIRKLEYVLPAARASGCARLVLDGTVESGCARAVAAYAPGFGLGVDLILYGEREKATKLATLPGVRVAHLAGWDPVAITELRDSIDRDNRGQGLRSYHVQTGATQTSSVFGSIDLATEIASQEDELNHAFDAVLLATGTGGTHAGLEIGRQLAHRSWRVIGVAVANDAAYFRGVFTDLSGELWRGGYLAAPVSDSAFWVHEGALGDGYGAYGPADLAAAARFREAHGLVLDCTYTNKAMLGLGDLVRAGAVQPGSNVLFIHTGLNDTAGSPCT